MINTIYAWLVSLGIFAKAAIVAMVPFLGYCAYRFVDYWFRLRFAVKAHDLAAQVGQRNRFHQQQGEAANELTRLFEDAKTRVEVLVNRTQPTGMNFEAARARAETAYNDLHNFVANNRHLFSVSLQTQMTATRDALRAIWTEANFYVCEALRRNGNPFDYPAFGQLWRTLRDEFGPLDANLRAEIQSLLAGRARG